MVQGIHLLHSHFMYARVKSVHHLRQFPDWRILNADISLNPSVSSVSTVRKLKSGSVSAVTFPAASLLLKCVPLASAKLQMQGTRTTFISAVIVNCDRSDPSSTLWCDLYFLSSYVQKDVWKELWRCVVPCTQLATEGVHWRWTNPSYFSTNTKKWKKNSTRFALTWWSVARWTRATDGKLELLGISQHGEGSVKKTRRFLFKDAN